MRTIIILTILAILSGCASPEPNLTKGQRDFAQQPISTATKQECDLAWQRTQLWIVKNSTWKLQIATEILLQTYGPGDTTDPAYTATKEPTSNGSCTISMTVSCGNSFVCFPNTFEQLYKYRYEMSQHLSK